MQIYMNQNHSSLRLVCAVCRTMPNNHASLIPHKSQVQPGFSQQTTASALPLRCRVVSCGVVWQGYDGSLPLDLASMRRFVKYASSATPAEYTSVPGGLYTLQLEKIWKTHQTRRGHRQVDRQTDTDTKTHTHVQHIQ